MAHLYHPNYTEYYQSEHRPLPNHGPCIKINCNAKYSSESEGISIVKYIAKKNSLPIQEFIVRQDSPCGTTIGPIIAGKCGIRAVDIGCPQLAMHSIREQTACTDLYNLKQLFIAFYKDYSEVSEVSFQ
jgi:aspartyl aminopeptidase